MLSAQLHGVDTDVQQDFRTLRSNQTNRVEGVKEVIHHRVRRGVQLALRGLDGHALAQYAGGKRLVLHLGHGDNGSIHVGVQLCVLLGGSGGLRGGGRGRDFRRSLVHHCRFRRLHEVHQVGFNHRHLGSVYHLHAVALVDDAGRAGLLEQRIGHLPCVNHRHTQPGGAAVHVGQIRLAAQSLEDHGGDGVGESAAGCAAGRRAALGVVVGAGKELRLLTLVLAARRLQVHPGNHQIEGEVVEHKVRRADNNHPDPVGLGVALENAEQGQVDESAGEGHAHAHFENVHQHEGQTRVYTVDGVHEGRDKDKGKLQRFRHAGEHGGEGGGNQKAPGYLFLLRLGGAVHRQRRAGQTEDHEGELTGHKPGGVHGEHLCGPGSQLRKKDVLCALNGHAVDDSGTAHSGLPEGHIEHMVQAEGDQRTLQNSVNPGARVAGPDDQIAQSRNAGLDDGPDVEHGDAHHHEDGGRDDGDEPCAAKERQRLGQLNLIEPVVQRRDAQSHDDAAEHAHLQGGDAQGGGGGVGGHGLHAAAGGNHGGDGGVHHQVRNRAGQSRHFLLLFRHADGHAHGEQQSQVVEHRASALIHNIQNGIRNTARIDRAGQAIRLQGGLVGERASDSQQQARHWQQGDRQHK